MHLIGNNIIINKNKVIDENVWLIEFKDELSNKTSDIIFDIVVVLHLEKWLFRLLFLSSYFHIKYVILVTNK